MKNKKWENFANLTDKCYMNMIGAEEDAGCWRRAFELLMEIVREERQKEPNYAPQMEQLEEAMEYEYDLQGWLEDCLDEIDMIGDFETLLHMCNDLLNIFKWPEYTGSDIKFRKAATLGNLGREKEAAAFCEKWIREEPENIVAATAGAYAFIHIRDFEKAEQLIDRFIPDKSCCTDDNDIMFTAASLLYHVQGRKKEKKLVDKAIKEYEEYLEEYFESFEDEEYGDEELPFK